MNRTQGDLAAELGVTRAYVSELVNGRKPFRIELQKECRKILDGWGC
jgi:plasmid maintenance system antidote protein VapI